MAMEIQVEEMLMHQMANIHDVLEMLPRCQNLHATQNKPRHHNKQMTALGYISETEEIMQECWSLFQHDRAAGF